jgi:hypothetical protein
MESDDWGSIRMSSKQAYDQLIAKGIPVNKNFFTKYDQLESADDMTALLETLSRIRDNHGRNAVLTTLNITANPDFDAMRDNGFTSYCYEPFTETQRKYGRGDTVIKLWQEGIQANLIHPEFHGREHLHVNRWLKGMRSGLEHTTFAEQWNVTGIPPEIAGEQRGDYQAAFDIDSVDDLPYMHTVFREGVALFTKMFGYAPGYFVPANGLLNRNLYQTISNEGVRWLYAARNEMEPMGDGVYKKHYRYLGMHTENGLTFINRNATFEPASPGQSDWIKKCMQDVAAAFMMKKPAIISTHRVNYIGGLDEANRKNGLQQLHDLLHHMIARWPDLEFMTTIELGRCMEKH